MSIVIALIDRLSDSLYFYGDKRQTIKNEDNTKSYSDDFTKIFKIKEDLFMGISGNAGLGLQLIGKAQQISYLSNDDIVNEIEKIQDMPVDDEIKVFGIIAGRNNQGELFIWNRQFNNIPEIKLPKLDSVYDYVISTSSTAGAYNFAGIVLQNEIISTRDCQLTIQRTIQAVSQMDPTVSPTFDNFYFSNHQP